MNRLPPTWATAPLRCAGPVFGGGTPDTANEAYWDGDIPWVSSQDVRGRSIVGTSRSITAAGLTGSSAQMAHAGDLAFVMRSGILRHTLPVGVLAVDAAVNQDIKVLRPTGPWLAPYVAYFVEGLQRELLGEWRSEGTTVESLRLDLMLRTPLPVPLEPTQKAIVDFLDRETEKIDALVAKKQRLIELLQEKRTALINHAVTKGLDPDVPMKDSGIEWLGLIPTHWPVVRLGHFAHVLNGSTPSRDDAAYWFDGTVPWLASTKVNEDRVTRPSELITETALRGCSLSLVPAGSVVIGLVGQGRTRGMAALLDIDTTINQNMAAIIPRHRLIGRYLQYQLENMYTPIREYGRGANQAALNCELIADLRLPLPPLDEQAAIARFLDDDTQATRALADKTRRSIDLLKESRSALITAAVTGQIDVRTYRREAS